MSRTGGPFGAVEFDAHLTASREPVGQGDQTAFIPVDPDVRAQFPGVTDAGVAVGVQTFGQAGRGRDTARDEYGVRGSDAAVASGEVTEEVRCEGAPVTVGSLGVDVGGGQGGRDDGVRGEGHRTFQSTWERREDDDPAVFGREPSVGGVQEEREQRMRRVHGRRSWFTRRGDANATGRRAEPDGAAPA